MCMMDPGHMLMGYLGTCGKETASPVCLLSCRASWDGRTKTEASSLERSGPFRSMVESLRCPIPGRWTECQESTKDSWGKVQQTRGGLGGHLLVTP